MLFVRKLATSVTEELLEKTFSQFGKLERVKKLKDYAFVHFEERDAAVKVCFSFKLCCMSDYRHVCYSNLSFCLVRQWMR